MTTDDDLFPTADPRALRYNKGQTPPLLPPLVAGEWTRLGREVGRHWFLVLCWLFSSVTGAGGLIYVDYQNTRVRQIVIAQNKGCVRSLGQLAVTGSSLALMGIQSPPPADITALQQNLAICQEWRANMADHRPLGGWSQELIREHVSTHQGPLQKQATAQRPNAPVSGT